MNLQPETIDLVLAWVWEYDRDFVRIVETMAHEAGLTTFRAERHNIGELTDAVKERRITVRSLLDRASDEDEAFLPLIRYVSQHRPEVHVINPHALQMRAADKATMHLEFLSHGIDVPYTIIVSPYNQKKETELSLSELARLGRPFIVKPANTTGGGVGVVLGAETLKDVLDARLHHRNDKYLLQETVRPTFFSERRAWFRVLYAFGEIIPCWWDDQTHLYDTITKEDERALSLETLLDRTKRIHEVCGLDFFSTEIAIDRNGTFVVVDYVNEICDMRLQSLHRDGVPDAVVERVCRGLIRFVGNIAPKDLTPSVA